MMGERNNYVAPYDHDDQIVVLFRKAYTDWEKNQLPQTAVPAIGTGQAIDAILKELEILS